MSDEQQQAHPDDSKPMPEQQADNEQTFPDLPVGTAWGESITISRASELEGVLQAWASVDEHGERKGPFDGVKLSGADVYWLAAHTLAYTAGNLATAEHQLRTAKDDVDLRTHLFNPPSLNLQGASLQWAQLQGAILRGAQLQGADLFQARLHGATLDQAQLQGANLHQTHFEEAQGRQGAYLGKAQMQKAYLYQAQLQGASLRGTQLQGADLRSAFFATHTTLDAATTLSDQKHGSVRVADVRWGEVNLAVVDWTQTRRGFLGLRKRTEAIELGDERDARSTTNQLGKPKAAAEWLQGYQDAVRANRQLATVLRSEGLNEHADRYAYRAQLCQRRLLRMQRHYLRYLGSLFLDLISGYGYLPWRSFFTYGLVIIGFMLTYMHFGVVDASCTITGMSTTGSMLAICSPSHTLTIQEAFVFSLTSFHGRGFFPGGLGLDSPITLVAAIEAVIGLLIEITFIATFTNRFFAR
jgi:hypothetical protein